MVVFIIKLEMIKKNDYIRDFLEFREMASHILLGEVYTSTSFLIDTLAKFMKVFKNVYI